MAAPADPAFRAQRRYDVDWLRVIALGLLILFHALSVFSLDHWVVKYSETGRWADDLMALLAPWRMPLVFFVGGAALRFLLDKVGPGGLVRDRLYRLVPPFLLAVLVLVPPAEYLSEREAGVFQGSFGAFLTHRLFGSVEYHGLHLPAQQHAWFLPYLLLYACVAALIAKSAPAALDWARARLERVGLWGVLALSAALYLAVDGLLNPFHQRSLLIFTDVTGHLRFAPIFALGFVLARSAPFWDQLVRRRGALSAGALAAMAALLAWRYTVDPFATGAAAMPLGALSGFYGALALFAALAWGAAVLNRGSPLLSYLNAAILPVYLLHMPILVAAAHFLRGAAAPPVWLALPVLLALSALAPLLLYEIAIKRFGPLRFLFGLKRERGGDQKPLSVAKRSRWNAAPP